MPRESLSYICAISNICYANLGGLVFCFYFVVNILQEKGKNWSLLFSVSQKADLWAPLSLYFSYLAVLNQPRGCSREPGEGVRKDNIYSPSVRGWLCFLLKKKKHLLLVQFSIFSSQLPSQKDQRDNSSSLKHLFNFLTDVQANSFLGFRVFIPPETMQPLAFLLQGIYFNKKYGLTALAFMISAFRILIFWESSFENSRLCGFGSFQISPWGLQYVGLWLGTTATTLESWRPKGKEKAVEPQCCEEEPHLT